MAKQNQLMQLVIVSQEKELINTQVEMVSAPASEGLVSILADHIPFFSRLEPGVVRYRHQNREDTFVISKGFIDVSPDNVVTIMVDTAKAARDISLVKAQQAMEAAKKTMAESSDRRELLLAEASLKQAMLEIQLARKTKHSQI